MSVSQWREDAILAGLLFINYQLPTTNYQLFFGGNYEKL